MNAIVLMLDALGDAPQRAIDAAKNQGFPFYRFSENPRPPKLKGTMARLKAITDSRNKSRDWINRQHPDSDFIALVDSDVVLPTNAVRDLLHAPRMITGAWVPQRGRTNRWIAATLSRQGFFANFKKPADEIIKTIMLPLAACVMPRAVFDALPVRAPDPKTYKPIVCGHTGSKMVPSEPYLYTLDLKRRMGLTSWMIPNIICEHIAA